MGQTLTNGIYLPAEGERNCYTGLAANWTALDSLIGGYNAHIGNATIHVTAEDKAAWNGKADASALTAHTGDTTIHVTAEDKATWNGKADASALTAHTGDTTIHVTAEDKAVWNGKADASALTAHTGDTTIHVTAEDKAKWDAVTGKANDADVVHKSGNETVGGVKTFTDNMQLKSNVAEYGVTSGSIQISFSDKNNVGLSRITQGVFNNGISYITLQLYGKDSNNQTVTNRLQYQYSSKFDYSYVLPTDNSVWLGSTGNRWGRIYGIQYYYGSNNVEFSQKFVTTDTNQTISGNKTFSSINGVEPSSLSLPDLANKIDISSYITDLNNVGNEYTPSVNGWISIRSANAAKISILDKVTSVGNASISNTATYLTVMTPVVANRPVYITVICTSLSHAYFIPCRGNV